MRKRRKKTNLKRVRKIGTFIPFTPEFFVERGISTKIAIEAQHGLIAQIIKDVIFSIRPRNSVAPNISQISDVTDMAIG